MDILQFCFILEPEFKVHLLLYSSSQMKCIHGSTCFLDEQVDAAVNSGSVMKRAGLQ